jgi:hypothetical protein
MKRVLIVIAIELQGHGHTPFSDRKLDFATLASDVEIIWMAF